MSDESFGSFESTDPTNPVSIIKALEQPIAALDKIARRDDNVSVLGSLV